MIDRALDIPTDLIHDTPEDVPFGMYNIDMVMTSGDARLKISVGGSDYKDISDSIKTASDSFNITVPKCQIKATITGDATVKIIGLRRGVY